MIKVRKGFLKWNLFKKIIDEIQLFYKNSDFYEFHFYIDGEPFLHPQYVDMLEYIDSKLYNIKILVSTNACLLGKDKADRILKLHNNNYILIFAMDSSNKVLYDRIRTGGDYYAMERNVGYFLLQKKEKGITNPYAVLQFIVMPINENDRHNFYWKWQSLLGPSMKDNPAVIWSGDLLVNNSAHIHWKEYDKTLATHEIGDYDLEDDNTFDYLSSQKKSVQQVRSKICGWLWKKMVIGWNGDVGLCSFHWESKGILGNLQNKSLENIFTGERINKIRWNFMQGNYNSNPICKDCNPRHLWHHQGLENYFQLYD